MRAFADEVLTQATRSIAPAIVLPPPRKRIRKPLLRHQRPFFGNKAYEHFRRIRDVGEQIRVWQMHNESEFFYRAEFERKKLKGQHKDDWKIEYIAWSPTKGESVEIEWLHDTKSSKSVKFEV